MSQTVDEFIAHHGTKAFVQHLSEKPWSDYTKADYSIEQWHAACLIHQHDGAPTSKDQCKIPVKTPNGAVNRNGVHAAAAALAGARGGVHASSEEKTKAAKSLIRYYHEMDEEPPPSLLKHSGLTDFIKHHGVVGMKWGVRRARGGVSKAKKPMSSDAKKVAELKKKKPSQLTNKQLKDINERLNLEQNYVRMNPSKVKKVDNQVKDMLKLYGTATAAVAAGTGAIAFIKSPKGQKLIKQAVEFVDSHKSTFAKVPMASEQLKLFD